MSKKTRKQNFAYQGTSKVINSNQNEITEQDVYNVFEFAKNLYSGTGGMYGTGVYSPMLVSEQMKNISMNPLSATEAKINQALLNPKDNEKQLLGYSEFFELNSLLYKRIMLYYATLLSYNLDIQCTNITSPEEYTTETYENDYRIVKKFFSKFDVKSTFQKITQMLIRDEVYFTAFNQSGNKYHFQQLPSDYCTITGRWESGFLMDFNMQYFMQPAVDINMYPDSLKDYFNKIFIKDEDGHYHVYNPDVPVNKRNGENWVYYVQTDPREYWTFKFNTNVSTRVPFLSALFPDIVLQPLMRTLQKNQNIVKASKMITGQVPMIKQTKGGSVTDAIAMQPETLGKFLSVFKAGLNDLIGVASAPLDNIQPIEFQYTDSDMFTNYNKSVASMSGNSSLLFSSEKQNTVESQLASNMDENIMQTVYSQYEDFLNFIVNQKTRKYRFKFKLSGFETFTSKKTLKENTIEMAKLGVIIPDKMAHVLGYNNRMELEEKLEMVQATDFVGKLSMLPNMFTTKDGGVNITKGTGKADGGGRPNGEDGDISDTGNSATDTSSNDSKLI